MHFSFEAVADSRRHFTFTAVELVAGLQYAIADSSAAGLFGQLAGRLYRLDVLDSTHHVLDSTHRLLVLADRAACIRVWFEGLVLADKASCAGII